MPRKSRKNGGRKPNGLRPKWPQRPNSISSCFARSSILEKITYGIGGLRARIGALVTGSGFAFGPEYFRDDLANGDVRFRATTQFSTKLYQLYDVELAFPKLIDEHAFFELRATHRNFPQMQYYGPGSGFSEDRPQQLPSRRHELLSYGRRQAVPAFTRGRDGRIH